MNETAPVLLLVDVMPLLYRGHFAFAARPRMTSSGVNTSAIFLFATAIAQMVREQGATHAALAMDTSPTFRHERFPAYKAQREKMPEDIAASIPMAEAFAAAMHLPFLRVGGFEADDVIGTLAARADAAGWRVKLFTPDKDFAQLVTERVTLCRPGKGDAPDEYTPDGVLAHWGVTPTQMPDYLGLAGDTADNIPGVPGVGEKTAVRLLQEHGSLEGVLAAAADIKGKLGERLRDHADDARLSRWLAEIRRDAPVPGTLDDLRVVPPDEAALSDFLARYELNALRRRLGLAAGAPAASAAAFPENPPRPEGDLFAFAAAVHPAASGGERSPSAELGDLFAFAEAAHSTVASGPVVRSESVPRPEEVAATFAAVAGASEWAFALETVPVPRGATPGEVPALRAVSFCTGPGAEWSLTVPPEGDAARATFLAQMREAFSRPGVVRIGHDVKRSLTVLAALGIEVPGPFRDTMLAHAVCDSAARHAFEAVVPATLSSAEAGRTPAGAVWALRGALETRARDCGAQEVLERCENPLVPVLFAMEREGIHLDTVALAAFGTELDADIATLERRVYEAVGEPFNLASPRQLGHALFDVLGLPPAGKTPTGLPETGEETLLALAPLHPAVRDILDWKTRTKLKSTYVDRLPQCIDPRDGRVHTTFHQALTETGRLSSESPNLQNIPVRTELGQRIRAAFTARDDDHELLSADYSQIELRVLASLSGDEAMCADFRKGSDIHAETAARVHGIPVAEVTREQRTQAKRVNFGIVYGISAFGLAQRLGIPRRQAAELIAAVKAAYPGIARFMEQAVESARATGFARTLLGRRRPIRDIVSRNATLRAAAERLAVNTPVQGSAADLIKLAMVAVDAEIRRRGLGARMILQIHDELLFDVPRAELDEVAALARETMEGVASLAVPLVVDVGHGRTWLDAH